MPWASAVAAWVGTPTPIPVPQAIRVGFFERTANDNAAAICVCHVSPLHGSLQRYTMRRVRRSATSQPVIIVALGKHPEHETSNPVITSLEDTIEALRSLKTESPKSKAKPD